MQTTRSHSGLRLRWSASRCTDVAFVRVICSAFCSGRSWHLRAREEASMQSVIDLIQEHFGDKPGPDLIAKLGGKLPPEFTRFREHYNVWRHQGYHIPPRKP